ncbi:MAG: RidA family protein [Nitrosopumilaceae archaeon]|nr:RidA family protein [Nitrosopumilaceae archaeon]
MIEERISEMGIALPSAPAPPAGSYIPVARSGSLLYVSGQIPQKDGKIVFAGKVSDSNVTRAQESARLCAINILAQAKSHLGDLERVERIVSLTGFVNSVPEFTQHPKVINAASDLLVEIFGGERGSHSRMAVGASSLPLGVMTEIGAVIQAKG